MGGGTENGGERVGEVGDESVFEVAAEGVGSRYDFEGASCGGGGGLGHGCGGEVKGKSEK